jgi:5-(carboxyamino)imidazole ribonucleotide synthase
MATTVGILGDGQLSRMLAEAALKLGLEPVVYAQSEASPALRVCKQSVIGALDDRAKLKEFLARVQVVAFENEFVDTELLRQAALGAPARFVPELQTIARLQDKLGQKEALVELGIPTPRFVKIEGDAEAAIREALDLFEGRCVLKWSRLGYDGKGVHFADESTVPAATAFASDAFSRGHEVYAEQRVAFRRELAIVGVLSTTGEFASFPLVVTEQEGGVCKRVHGPATAVGVDRGLDGMARHHAKRIAEATRLQGAFAIELFETGAGELLVNEIAPRVHNSGHYTLDACACSQFENHWRALLGMPLGPTEATEAFAMRNLLGPPGVKIAGATPPMPLPASGIRLHWYDKQEIRPGRKVGHLNATADSPSRLKGLIAALDECAAAWEKRLK